MSRNDKIIHQYDTFRGAFPGPSQLRMYPVRAHSSESVVRHTSRTAWAAGPNIMRHSGDSATVVGGALRAAQVVNDLPYVTGARSAQDGRLMS